MTVLSQTSFLGVEYLKGQRSQMSTYDNAAGYVRVLGNEAEVNRRKAGGSFPV